MYLTVLFLGDSCRGLSAFHGSHTGVYVGCIWSEFGDIIAKHDSMGGNKGGNAMAVTGNGLAFMAGRVSYTFGLTGRLVMLADK
jgi:acyl transferase domain-containing protein